MGIVPIYRKPRLIIPRYNAKGFPYMLKGTQLQCPDQEWGADITYIPMKQGDMYLVAMMDWFSRKVLSWSLSSTMDKGVCVVGLKASFAKSNKLPEIINGDQRSEFTGTPGSKWKRNEATKAAKRGKDARWTMSSSRDCGGTSSMKVFYCGKQNKG